MFFLTNELEQKAINQLLEELDVPTEEGFHSARAIHRADKMLLDDSDIPEASDDTSFNRLLDNIDNYLCPSSFYATL